MTSTPKPSHVMGARTTRDSGNSASPRRERRSEAPYLALSELPVDRNASGRVRSAGGSASFESSESSEQEDSLHDLGLMLDEMLVDELLLAEAPPVSLPVEIAFRPSTSSRRSPGSSSFTARTAGSSVAPPQGFDATGASPHSFAASAAQLGMAVPAAPQSSAAWSGTQEAVSPREIPRHRHDLSPPAFLLEPPPSVKSVGGGAIYETMASRAQERREPEPGFDHDRPHGTKLSVGWGEAVYANAASSSLRAGSTRTRESFDAPGAARSAAFTANMGSSAAIRQSAHWGPAPVEPALERVQANHAHLAPAGIPAPDARFGFAIGDGGSGLGSNDGTSDDDSFFRRVFERLRIDEGIDRVHDWLWEIQPYLRGLASLILPGWGQCLNEQPVKGRFFRTSSFFTLAVADLLLFRVRVAMMLSLVIDVDPSFIAQCLAPVAIGGAFLWLTAVYDAFLVSKTRRDCQANRL